MIFLLNRNKKSDDTSPERIPRLRITSILSVSPKPKIFISMRMYDSRVSSSTEVNTRMIRFYDILVPSLFRVQTSWSGECVRDIDFGGSGVLFPLWCHQRFFSFIILMLRNFEPINFIINVITNIEYKNYGIN